MRVERESESERRSLKTRKGNFDARNVKEVEEFNFPSCLLLSQPFRLRSSLPSSAESSLVTAKLRFRLTKNNKNRRNQIVREKRVEGFCRFIFSSPEKEDKKNKLAVSEEERSGICWRGKLPPY
jgi:hypothetical protein